MQTYKKVLLLLLIISFTTINEGCHKKIYPTSYPDKPGIFPITFPKKEYRFRRNHNYENKKLNRIEKKINRKSERAKRDALKSQEEGRKQHINRQAPKVQERMKKSLEQSEKTRTRKSFWERLLFWKRPKSKEKKL